MFLSKSKEGLSSTLAVAMFTNDNEYQYAIVRFNHISDTTIQVELQQIEWSFKNYQSVQSMSMIWNIQETKQGCYWSRRIT